MLKPFQHFVHDYLGRMILKMVSLFVYRFLPYIIPEKDKHTDAGPGAATGGIDLSTLRTFRVLRPLKLVSGVPSKSGQTFI